MDTDALSATARTAVSLCGLAVLAAITVLAWTRRTSLRRDPRTVVAALGALTLSVLIFSPIAWEHYHLYLLPTWAWLIAEALRKPQFGVAAVAILAASWAPVCVFDDGALVTSEPLVSHMLWGSVALLALTVLRLVRTRKDTPPASCSPQESPS
jgi:hypothetical protein